VIIALALTVALAVLASLPCWLPRSVVAPPVWPLARVNGTERIAIPGDLVDDSRFPVEASSP
jgi:hypothetical protein